MLGCIILTYIDAHFSHGRRLPDVSFKVSTSSRPLTQIALLLGLTKHLACGYPKKALRLF